MKNNYIYKTVILLTALVVFGACEKQDWTYSGPQFYEFSAQKNNQGVKSNLIFKENSKVGKDSVCVQIIKPSNGQITVNYEIVDKVYYLSDKDKYVAAVPQGTDPKWVDTLYSDAVYGTDYEIVTTTGARFTPATNKGSVTIAKDEFFGYIEVNLLVKSGKQFFILLNDSEEALANKPTGLMQYIISPDKVYYIDDSFLTGLPDTWTIIDKDGDGYNWNYYRQAMTSDSYVSGDGALNPENYLVSPAVTLPSRIDNVSFTFEVASGASGDYREQYRVVVSEEPMTLENCRDAVVVRDWTELTAIHASKNYTLETVDLSQFKGKTIYVAILHGNCTDQYYINIRNVKLFSH